MPTEPLTADLEDDVLPSFHERCARYLERLLQTDRFEDKTTVDDLELLIYHLRATMGK